MAAPIEEFLQHKKSRNFSPLQVIKDLSLCHKPKFSDPFFDLHERIHSFKKSRVFKDM